MRADKSQKRDSAKMRRDILDAPVIPSPAPLKNIKGVDEWDYLPTLPDTIEAVNQFTRNYFQLGFIPKQAFPERLRTDPGFRAAVGCACSIRFLFLSFFRVVRESTGDQSKALFVRCCFFFFRGGGGGGGGDQATPLFRSMLRVYWSFHVSLDVRVVLLKNTSGGAWYTM